MQRRASAATVMIALLATPSFGIAKSDDDAEAMRRDLNDYAIASCLTLQSSAYLRDQGDGWGSVIVQRSEVPLSSMRHVVEAVKTAASKTPLPVARDEAHPYQGKVLQIMYCMDLIRSPAMRAALSKPKRLVGK